MKEETRTIGYLCPGCRKIVEEERSCFSLEASGAAVACACGGSELKIQSDGERFRITVPCGVCGGEHTAECSAQALLEGEGIGLACPKTKELCCFIGKDYAVDHALSHLNASVVKENAQGEDRQAFADSFVMYEVLSELKEIAAREHGVSCGCGSENYTMEIRPAAVDLICRDCGAKLRIGAATDEDLTRLCCQYRLRIPGKRGNV